MANKLFVSTLGALIVCAIIGNTCLAQESDNCDELWNKLNDASLSVDQVEDILRSVKDKKAAKLGLISVAELIGLKDVRLTVCNQVDLDRLDSLNFRVKARKDGQDNEGVNKFANYYYERLMDNCIKDLGWRIDIAQHKIKRAYRDQVDQFAGSIVPRGGRGDSPDESEVQQALHSYLTRFSGWNRLIVHNRRKLKEACKRVIDSMPERKFVDKSGNWNNVGKGGSWNNATRSKEITYWLKIVRACEILQQTE